MSEFLQQSFYDNTIMSWLGALAIMVATVVIGKIVYWFFSNTIRRLTNKTRTQVDDIIIDMIEEPLVVILIIAGIWFGLQTLTLSQTIQTIINHIGQFSVMMMVGWLIVRLLDSVYVNYLAPKVAATESDLDEQILPILRKGSKFIIWSLAIIIGLNNAGYDVAALIAGLGIGGLALALAAKDTVANIFGGFTIFTDKPFTINDRVKVKGYDGMVKEVGVRSTRLQTLEGRIVTIPNATFADSPVENVSWEPSRKVLINLGLTYDTTPEQMDRALTLLQEINACNDDTEEETIISFDAFGDFAMNVMFIYYIKKDADIPNTQSAINLAILRQFTAAGLEFAFPTQTLYNK